MLLRYANQVLCGGFADSLEVVDVSAMIAAQYVKASEFAREPRDALPFEVFVGEEVGAGTLELVG